MFGFGEHQRNLTAICPCCLSQMEDKGTHGMRMGGLTGLGGCGLGHDWRADGG